MGFYFSPNAKMFHLVVKMKEVPGALSSVLALLADKVDLVESMSYGAEDGRAIWSGFGKSLSKSATEGKLKSLVERSPMVIECEVKESDNGLIVDSFHAGVEVAPGRPAMIFPHAGFSRICDHLVRSLGSGGETVLFEEGSALGQSTGRYLNARLGQRRLDLRVKAALSLYRADGFGSPSLEVEEPGARFRITVHDCPECAETETERKECSFLRGHLVSVISTLSGSEFGAKETSCRLRGNPSCQFLLRGRAP